MTNENVTFVVPDGVADDAGFPGMAPGAPPPPQPERSMAKTAADASVRDFMAYLCRGR